jgi:hypothetical protein
MTCHCGARRSKFLHGVVVDCFLGERERVVQLLDSRLGKMGNISVPP